MDILEKIIRENCWKFDKGYPDMDIPKDVDLLNEIVEGYKYKIKEEEEIKSVDDLKVDIILDPEQEAGEIEDKKDDLQDLLKTVTDSKSKDKIASFIKNLEYIDKVNHYLDKKNYDDIEEILVKAFIDRNNQYKIFQYQNKQQRDLQHTVLMLSYLHIGHEHRNHVSLHQNHVIEVFVVEHLPWMTDQMTKFHPFLLLLYHAQTHYEDLLK